MLADEFSEGQPGFGVLGGLSRHEFKSISYLFEKSSLYVSCSADVYGVAYAGVLKNIYALGLGMCHGLKVGKNAQGWYLAEAMNEMREILKRLKAHGATADSWAGLGDLVATGFLVSSRAILP